MRPRDLPSRQDPARPDTTVRKGRTALPQLDRNAPGENTALKVGRADIVHESAAWI